MKHLNIFSRLFFLFVCSVVGGVVVAMGCGNDNSSSTSSGTALELAEKISVVDASTSATGSTSLSKGLTQLIKVNPPNATDSSDWTKDKVRKFVAERSAEAFDIVNEILCMKAQTKYSDKLGKGNYKALVDINQCSQENDSAATAGQNSTNQTSGSTRTEYASWIVDSALDGSNHVLKMWIREDADDHEPAKLICMKTTISESTSSTNPYGLFVSNFAAYPGANTTCEGVPIFKGFLKAEKDENDKVLLKFIVEGGFAGAMGDSTFSESAVLDRSADGKTMQGRVAGSNSFGGKSESYDFLIASNEEVFMRKNAGSTVCLSRTDFHESAWRYGLYDANGKRVTRNSGFSVVTADGKHGYIGYWGLWLQDGTVNNGDTIYKEVFSEDGSTKTPYTVVKIGAKLKKHTKHTTTLVNIKNLPLDMFDNSTMTNVRVKWNGSKFVKFATMSQNDWFWKNITEADLAVSDLSFGELNFWSQAMGGQVRVPLENCQWNESTQKNSCDAPSNTTSVIYFTEDIVYPDDAVPSSFRCYDNCPKYDATSGVVAHENDYSPTATGHNYTFSDMLLKDGSNNSLIMATESQSLQWGFNSGPLFQATQANLDLLKCDWDVSKTCGWKAWSELSEYYTYETGPNQWNQFSGLKDDAGVFLEFEAPLPVDYVHSQTDTTADDYKYDGVKFFLDYSGFGDLHGIPGTCTDMDTGEPTDCSGDSNIRWRQQFMIPEGATVTSNNVTYYVKPLEVEQVMKSRSCPADASFTSYEPPAIGLWEDPAIGQEPTLDGAPAVIGGIIQ